MIAVPVYEMCIACFKLRSLSKILNKYIHSTYNLFGCQGDCVKLKGRKGELRLMEAGMNQVGNLMAVKKELDLTYDDIADATGVRAATVSRYFSGKMKIPATWKRKFCETYNVDEEWFFQRDGEPVFTEPVDAVITRDASGAGARVAQMRKELGIGQQKIYELLGITQTMYSRIENGHSKLTMENAQKIEDAFGIGTEWLLYGDEGKKKYPVGNRMVEWLWENEEERKRIWDLMRDEK